MRLKMGRVGWGAVVVALGAVCSGALWAGTSNEVVITEPVRATTVVSEATRTSAERYAGGYVADSVQTNTQSRDAAIEALIEELNVLIRPIARQKLRDGNPIAAGLEIAVEGDTITVAFDGKRDVAALDGTQTTIVGIQGDALDYHVDVKDSRLRQVYSGERGGRSNEIRIRKGKVLSIQVEMTSSRLPRPLRYELSYRPR